MSTDTHPLARDRSIVLHLKAGSPEWTLDVPASEDSLPLVRQALRSLGESLQVEAETLEDVELAVTEATANAIEHAYDEGGGDVQVEFASLAGMLSVGVVDHGVGIHDFTDRDDGTRGFGLAMIRDIASSLEFRPGDGTDIRMEFALGETLLDDAAFTDVSADAAERIVRRLVASMAAQVDMTTDRVIEALLLAELLARNAFAHLASDEAEVRIERAGAGFILSAGPLAPGGADAALAASEVPVVGSVLAKLATEANVEIEEAGEFLALRVDPR